jgi:alginate O-acetyltransferase complex protein AlgI
VIFTSFEFIFFFLLVVLVRGCVRNFTAEKWFLLGTSICFYLTWSIPCVVFILFTSLVDYSIGRKLGQTTDAISRKRLLLLSLTINLGLLGFFKYSNFFLDNVWFGLSALGIHVPQSHFDIILPPAISFYTFASITYIVDVYYERIPVCESARDYTLFITFFPKVLSGPIVRAGEFLPQLKERVRASREDFEIGISYLLTGAVKKLVIADQIAGQVTLIFAAPGRYDGFTLLQGLLGYAVQLYCDFAGYSDMAIGCARILGFKFPQNFQMPFSSITITEFWRRWHITMSRWFRDYLFFPLEMATRDNFKPNLPLSVNMTTTMLLCGLWHGASWNFVVWGGIHGAALSAHRIWTTWNPLVSLKQRLIYRIGWNVFSRALTLGVVLLSLVFFRTQSLSDAASYLGLMLSWSHHGMRVMSPLILAAVAAVFLTHLLINKDRNLAEEVPQMAVPVRITAYAGLILLLVSLGATDAAPFLYFEF